MLMAPFNVQKKVRQLFLLALGIVLGTGPSAFVLAYLAQLAMSVIAQFRATSGMNFPPTSFDSGSALGTAVVIAYIVMLLSGTYIYLKTPYKLIDELERYARALQDHLSSRLRTSVPDISRGGRVVQVIEELLLPATAGDELAEGPQNHQSPHDVRHTR